MLTKPGTIARPRPPLRGHPSPLPSVSTSNPSFCPSLRTPCCLSLRAFAHAVPSAWHARPVHLHPTRFSFVLQATAHGCSFWEALPNPPDQARGPSVFSGPAAHLQTCLSSSRAVISVCPLPPNRGPREGRNAVSQPLHRAWPKKDELNRTEPNLKAERGHREADNNHKFPISKMRGREEMIPKITQL